MANEVVRNLNLQVEQLSDRSFLATWDPPKGKASDTDKYRVIWYYYYGTKKEWIVGSDEEVEHRSNYNSSSYSVPTNSFKAYVAVKPIPKGKKYTGGWKKTDPLKVPSVPNSIVKAKKVVASFTSGDEHPLVGTWTGYKNTDPPRKTTDFENALKHLNITGYSYSFSYWNGNTWSDGDSGTVGKNVRSAYATTIPNDAKQAKFIVAPIVGMDSGWEAYAEFFTADAVSDTVKFSKESWVIPETAISKGLLTNANRTVRYSWRLVKSLAFDNLTGFVFEYRSKNGKTWSSIESQTVDVNTKIKKKNSIAATIGSNLIADQPSSWEWSTTVDVPDNTTIISARITPEFNESSGYVGKATNWIDFKYDPPSKTLTGVDVKRDTDEGGLYGWWYTNESENRSSDILQYEYVWRYKTSSNGEWKDGNSGTISRDALVWYRTPLYNPPIGWKQVAFKIKPSPRYSNSFTGVYCTPIVKSYSSLTPTKKVTGLAVEMYDLANRTFYASWNAVDGAGSYSYYWEYIKNGFQITESTTTTSLTNCQYSYPEGASEVTFTVAPVPSIQDAFSGDNVSVTKSIIIRQVEVGVIYADLLENVERTFAIGWKPKVDYSLYENNVSSYTWYTEYFRNGLWQDGSGETTINNAAVELQIPADVVETLFWVKPNDDANGNLFEGKYKRKQLWINVPHRKIILDEPTLQNGSLTTVVATWYPELPDNIASYTVEWSHMIGGVWIAESTSSVSSNLLAATYDAPAEAEKVRVRVKAEPEYSKFEPIWSNYEYIEMPGPVTPDKPSAPNVEIKGYTLIAKLDTYDTKAERIEFEVVTTDESLGTSQALVVYNRATYQCSIMAGAVFRVRCRGINENGEAGEWSEYSSDIAGPPAGLSDQPVVQALSMASVEITWEEVDGADSYEIEYAEKARYFDANPSQVKSETIETGTRLEITDFDSESDSGKEWFFRVRAVNSDSNTPSEWSAIVSCILGTEPSAPTTWSSTATATTSQDVYLYWLHNSEDNSLQTAAEMELTVDGVVSTYLFNDEGCYAYAEPEEVDEVTSSLTYETDGGTYSVSISSIPAPLRTTDYLGLHLGDLIDDSGVWSYEYDSDIASWYIDDATLYFVTVDTEVTEAVTTTTVDEELGTSTTTTTPGQVYTRTLADAHIITTVANTYWMTAETEFLPDGSEYSVDISDIPVSIRDANHVALHLGTASHDVYSLDSYIASFRIDGTNLYYTTTEDSSVTTAVSTTAVAIATADADETVLKLVYSPDDEGYSTDTEGSWYYMPAGTYESGATVLWRVRTKGVMPDYGPWSTQRSVRIYTPPVLTMVLSNYENVGWLWDEFNFNEDNIYTATGTRIPIANETLNVFPLIVYLNSYPASQTPISYTLTIISKSNYETADDTGRTIQVRSGQEVFSKYYSTDIHDFMTIISAGDVHLEEYMNYTVKAVVAMDSGLTAEVEQNLYIDWDYVDEFDINAVVSYNEKLYESYVTPYCYDENGGMVSDVLLSVYRREFDGAFMPIATNIANTAVTVTDPHPALDYARYRVTARSTFTGKIDFYDIPAYPIEESSIIIQWNEQWQEYDTDMPRMEDDPLKNGSLLVLPYNIDVSDSNTIDSELIEYIGRRHPVSYYGTQVGQESSWKTDIPKSDKETIYALRRLAVWLGNCYVREPSGTGYWARVTVSFDINHTEVIVPVTLGITRVEGGM